MSDCLKQVYWIGGGSGAGKTTIARHLSKKYDLYHYSTDDAMQSHVIRCTEEHTPFLDAFKEMDMDERWVNRSPQMMLETFHWYNGECFDLIIEDIRNLAKKRGVVVEGFRLLPNLVKPFFTDKHQAVWLLPTDDFRKAAFESRGTLWEIANKTTNPKQALQNLLARDSLFTGRLQKELEENNMPVIKVDKMITEAKLLGQISKQFGLL